MLSNNSQIDPALLSQSDPASLNGKVLFSLIKFIIIFNIKEITNMFLDFCKRVRSK
jgi:hypothetical protein